MSDATVVDQLIVKLGLDPSGFTKGQKEVASQLVKTEEQAKKSGDNIASSVLGAIGKIAGITTVAAVALKAVGYMSSLSTSIRRLGIDATNLGLSAPALKNFQNAAEIMGGTAEGITKTINGFQKSIFDMAFNGQMSESLVMLGRLGVQFQTADGHARDFNDVMVDTAAALQKAQQNGTMTRAEASQYAAEAGFGDTGSQQLVLAGPDAVRAEMARTRGLHQINGTELAYATDWERSAANRNQHLAAGAVRQLPKAAAFGIAANDKASAAADVLTDPDAFEKLGSAVADGLEAMTTAAKHFLDVIKDYGSGQNIGGVQYKRSNYDGAINAAAKKYGIDGAVLAGIINTESGFHANAESVRNGKVVGRGIAQLNPQVKDALHRNAGLNPINDIYAAAAIYSQNLRHYKDLGNDDLGSQHLALQAYNAGTGAVDSGRNLSAETQQYPNKVLAYANAHPTPSVAAAGSSPTKGGNTTTVEIGSMAVYTQATDADGVAAGIEGGLQRKLMASQSEQGVQ